MNANPRNESFIMQTVLAFEVELAVSASNERGIEDEGFTVQGFIQCT